MNKKRLTATVGAMALTGLLAVAGTFAFLQQVTETKHNVFTSSKDIDTELTEKDYDEEEAKNYYPGQVIAKNPVMHNESEDGNPIWVAVKLDYKDNDDKNVSKEEFISKYATLEGFSDEWELLAVAEDGSEVYMFKTILDPGAESAPIFTGTKVLAGISEVIKSGTESTTVYDKDGNIIEFSSITNSSTKYYNEAGEEIDIFELPKFEIAVQGLAVQALGVDHATAATQLLSLAVANGFVAK